MQHFRLMGFRHKMKMEMCLTSGAGSLKGHGWEGREAGKEGQRGQGYPPHFPAPPLPPLCEGLERHQSSWDVREDVEGNERNNFQCLQFHLRIILSSPQEACFVRI